MRTKISTPTVLHLTAPGAFGGLESVLLALATGLRQAAGADVAVALVVEDIPPAALLGALEEAGVRVVLIKAAARAYLAEAQAVAKAVRSVRADIVHTHGYRSDLVGGMTAKATGTRWISTAHGFTGGGWKNRFYERLQRSAWRRADRVIAVSEPLRASLEQGGVPTARLVGMMNAICPGPRLHRDAARAALGLPSDGHVVGWVGRMSHEKDPLLAVHALAALSDPRPTLVFVGDGPLRAEVVQLASELGLADRVRWVGPRAGARQYFAAFDVLLLSSRTEGTPIVLLEAMEAGVPVAATDVGGVRHATGDQAATLVRHGDAASLGAALGMLLGNSGHRDAQVAAAHHRFADAFGFDHWIARHEALYRAVAHGG